MRTFLFLLVTLFAIFSVTYTLNTEKQETSMKQEDDNDNDVKAFMEELMKGVIAQMQEEDDQKLITEMQSTLNDQLSQVQDDEDDGEVLKQDGDDNSDKDLLALLQEEDEENDGALKQDDEDGDNLLALLQDDNDDDAELQDDDDGDDAIEQRWQRRLYRYLKCLPKMKPEMRKADNGDEDLAKDMLRRVANKQQDDGDTAETQFFRKLIKLVKRKPKQFMQKVRQYIGRLLRTYRKMKKCIGRRSRSRHG